MANALVYLCRAAALAMHEQTPEVAVEALLFASAWVALELGSRLAEQA